MEKIGLANEYLSLLNENWKNYQLVHSSKEQQAASDGLDKSCAALKKICKLQDIVLISGVEEVNLRQEIIFYANSPEEVRSINTALTQLEEARRSLSVLMNDKPAYLKTSETFSSKRKESGLPIDAFREFIKSHTTRLSNRLASPLSVPEKNILRQRKENLQVAKKLYVEMQLEALGLSKGKDKDRGVER